MIQKIFLKDFVRILLNKYVFYFNEKNKDMKRYYNSVMFI